MNSNTHNDNEKALTMNLYDNASIDPYLGLSIMTQNKLITKNNALKWLINTDLKYISSDELIALKPGLFALDKQLELPNVDISEPNVDLLDSENEISLLSSKRQSSYDNTNLIPSNKKAKVETYLALSQECTYTTHNSDIIESEVDDMIFERGYVRGETLLTFASDVNDTFI